MAKRIFERPESFPRQQQFHDRNSEDVMLAKMPLHQLRIGRKLSQAQVAVALGTKQAAISKMERRPDVCISTLRRYIEAMGGRLVIHAHFPDDMVEISQYGLPDNLATNNGVAAGL